jgi:hypothetical protein
MDGVQALLAMAGPAVEQISMAMAAVWLVGVAVSLHR